MLKLGNTNLPAKRSGELGTPDPEKMTRCGSGVGEANYCIKWDKKALVVFMEQKMCASLVQIIQDYQIIILKIKMYYSTL